MASGGCENSANEKRRHRYNGWRHVVESPMYRDWSLMAGVTCAPNHVMVLCEQPRWYDLDIPKRRWESRMQHWKLALEARWTYDNFASAKGIARLNDKDSLRVVKEIMDDFTPS